LAKTAHSMKWRAALKKVNAKKRKANLPSKEGKRNPVERLGFFVQHLGLKTRRLKLVYQKNIRHYFIKVF